MSYEKNLRQYHDVMPLWARKAYFNDTLIHRTTRECADRNVKPENLPWELLAAIFNENKRLQDELFTAKTKQPVIYLTDPNLDQHGHIPRT